MIKLRQVKAEAQDRLDAMAAHVDEYEVSAKGQYHEKWQSFLPVWNQWYAQDRDFFIRLENALANSSPEAVDDFYQFVREQNVKRARVTRVLITNLRELVEIGIKCIGDGMQDTMRDTRQVQIMTIVAVFFALLALAFFTLSVKSSAIPKIGVARDTLLRIADEQDFTERSRSEIGEVVAAFDTLMIDLQESFRSIEIRLKEVDRGIDMLTSGTRQIMADQTNLCALNSALEAARPQQNGFAVVAGEIYELSERTNRLTGDICGMASRLRVTAQDAMTELERVARKLESGQITGRGADRVVKESRVRVEQAVDTIAEALQVAPDRIMAGLMQVQMAVDISESLQKNPPPPPRR
jgi:methyl-accepting chemotaxis protein